MNYSPIPWAQLAADQILVIVADNDPILAVQLRSVRMRVRQALLPSFRSISTNTVPDDQVDVAFTQLISSMQQTPWASNFQQQVDAIMAALSLSFTTAKEAIS